MKKIVAIGMFVGGVMITGTVWAQVQAPINQPYRLVEGVVQIAKPGEESIMVSLWGDVNAPGLCRLHADCRPYLHRCGRDDSACGQALEMVPFAGISLFCCTSSQYM